MTKRTIEVSGEGTAMHVRHNQLYLERDGELVGQVPIEDIGLLIVDTPRSSYTHSVLTKMMGFGGVIVLCGDDHLPASVVAPLSGHHLAAERLRAQVEAKLPVRKALWQAIVRAKIRHQAIATDDDGVRERLLRLEQKVKTGDPENVEAHAARLYWSVWLGKDSGFRRSRDGPPPNNLLNYGYMALRASVARALVGSGLHPSLALRHVNRYNAYGLADDLMEPFRPLIDVAARELWRAGIAELDRTAKRTLLGLLTATCKTATEVAGPLLSALERLSAHLAQCLAGEIKKLDIPCPDLAPPAINKEDAPPPAPDASA